MRPFFRRLAAPLLAALCLAGCDGGGPTDAGVLETSDEAVDLATLLSGELRAPAALASQVQLDLDAMRAILEERGDTLGLRIRHQPLFVPGMTVLSLDSASTALAEQGLYRGWDRANRTCGVDEVEPLFGSTLPQWYTARSAERLHPRRMAELYAALPGVLSAERNGIVESTSYGDSNILPASANDERSYLLRNLAGPGDDGVWPGGARLWFFRASGGALELVGAWQAADGPPPAWLGEAAPNFELWESQLVPQP